MLRKYHLQLTTPIVEELCQASTRRCRIPPQHMQHISPAERHCNLQCSLCAAAEQKIPSWSFFKTTDSCFSASQRSVSTAKHSSLRSLFLDLFRSSCLHLCRGCSEKLASVALLPALGVAIPGRHRNILFFLIFLSYFLFLCCGLVYCLRVCFH